MKASTLHTLYYTTSYQSIQHPYALRCMPVVTSYEKKRNVMVHVTSRCCDGVECLTFSSHTWQTQLTLQQLLLYFPAWTGTCLLLPVDALCIVLHLFLWWWLQCCHTDISANWSTANMRPYYQRCIYTLYVYTSMCIPTWHTCYLVSKEWNVCSGYWHSRWLRVLHLCVPLYRYKMWMEM